MFMAIVFLRSAIIYVALLIIMRFMGKRQIGEMQPFELVVTMLVAELACIPMSDVSIPLLYGITAIISVYVLHQLMTMLEHSGAFMKFLISGRPSIVVNKNGVDFKELRRNNIDVSDLIENMRGLGMFSLEEIEYAICESNGTLSAIKRQNAPPSNMPILIIKNGGFVVKNLSTAKLNKEKVLAFLKSNSIKKLKNVAVMTVDGTGRYYLQEYGEKYTVGKIETEAKW